MQDEELPSLSRLEQKINQTKEARPKPPQDVTNTGNGIALRLSSEMVAGVLVGLIVGYYLDKWLGTSPVLFLVCLGLGMVAGFMTVLRTIKAMDAAEQRTKEDK